MTAHPFAHDAALLAEIAAALPAPPARYWRMALEDATLTHWTTGGRSLTLCTKSTVPMIVADAFGRGVTCKECNDARTSLKILNPLNVTAAADGTLQLPPEDPDDEPLQLDFRF